MNVKSRLLEVDAETAALLEARAAARNLTVAELLADLSVNEAGLPAELAAQRALGTGAWAPEVLEDDAKRLAGFRENRLGVPWDEARAWLESWGDADKEPPPVRKL
ncbi:hypothetical protein [Maricaulis maris]|uniref:hypothetical protein n=1 Tax=Maricaulis maris TaxID=74318 RepID=UPI0026EA8527|nr:hypothetical protein [Maricaulis maris]